MKRLLFTLLLLNTLLANAQEIEAVKHYFPNGNVSEEGFEKDGVNIGSWKFYDEEGNIALLAQYNDKGKETGEWKYFHSGKLSMLKTYKNGVLDGVEENYRYGFIEWINIYENGLLIETRDYYKNGNLKSIRKFNRYGDNGEWQSCQGDGELYILQTFKDGKRNGLEKIYYSTFKSDMLFGASRSRGDKQQKPPMQKCYENKLLKSIGNYENNYKKGTWKEYYKNGNLLSIGDYDYSRYENDTIYSYKTGLWKTYEENGDLDRVGNYIKGKKVGIWKSYYEGRLSSVGKYKKGLAKGKWKIYYSVGGYGFETYKNGKKNGKTKQYYANGKLLLSGSYKNNKKHKKWKYYDKNGDLTEITNWENGNRNGVHQQFRNNRLWIEEHYKNGKKAGYWKIFSFNTGEIITSYEYIDGVIQNYINYYDCKELPKAQKKGIWKDYNEGHLVSVGKYKNTKLEGKFKFFREFDYGFYTFKNGKRNGKSKTYHNNGKLAIKGQYKNDVKNGKWKWYDENGKLSTFQVYKNGEKNGKYREYNNGNLWMKGYYTNDEKSGHWKIYNVDTKKLIREIDY